jgi:3-hydroxybutyryl-CoA dehydrogenase
MLINEAAEAFSLKIATRDDIDTAMTKGVNYPKGLLNWCDEIGAENVLRMLEGLKTYYSEERYRPSPFLKEMAAAGRKFYA